MTIFKVFLLTFSLSLSGQKIKTVYKYLKYADTLKYDDNKFKWLIGKKEFFPNGLQRTVLYMSVGTDPRDTSSYLKYELNKDSTLKYEREYRSYKYGWVGKSTFIYKKGNKNPIELKLNVHRKVKVTYEYNHNNDLIREKTLYRKKVNYETEYIYDSLNRLQQSIRHQYSNGIKQRFFSLHNYTYTEYNDSLVCVQNYYLVNLSEGDSIRTTEKIPKKFDLFKSQYYDDINTYCIITTYNKKNEIISEKNFSKSIRDDTRGQMTLYLKYFYVYEYYK